MLDLFKKAYEKKSCSKFYRKRILYFKKLLNVKFLNLIFFPNQGFIILKDKNLTKNYFNILKFLF